MPIGYGDTLGVANLNSMLGGSAVQLRDACAEIMKMWSAVNALGVEGLTSIGFGTDAQLFFDQANYLQTVAQIYYGKVAQAEAYNFDNQLAPVRAGQ